MKYYFNNILIALLCLVIGVMLVIFFRPDNTESLKTAYVSHLRCIDGDSFSSGEKQYRLSWIDTPEYDREYYWKEAKEFTCDFLLNNPVRLVEHGEDKYGRTLVEVHYGDNDDTLNELLIKKCLAEPFYTNTQEWLIGLYKERCK